MPNNEKDKDLLKGKETEINSPKEDEKDVSIEKDLNEKENNDKKEDKTLKEEKKSEEKQDDREEKKSEEEKDDKEEKDLNPEKTREEVKSRLASGVRMSFKNGKGKFSFKGFIMLIFILTVLISLPSILNDVEKAPTEEVSYTKFIDMAKNHKIDSVEEKEGYVYGFVGEEEDLKGFKTRMITDRLGTDAKLVAALENSDISIQSIPPQELPFFVSMLASWFPMLLLIGVWFFMLGRL